MVILVILILITLICINHKTQSVPLGKRMFQQGSSHLEDQSQPLQNPHTCAFLRDSVLRCDSLKTIPRQFLRQFSSQCQDSFGNFTVAINNVNLHSHEPSDFCLKLDLRQDSLKTVARQFASLLRQSPAESFFKPAHTVSVRQKSMVFDTLPRGSAALWS